MATGWPWPIMSRAGRALAVPRLPTLTGSPCSSITARVAVGGGRPPAPGQGGARATVAPHLWCARSGRGRAARAGLLQYQPRLSPRAFTCAASRGARRRALVVPPRGQGAPALCSRAHLATPRSRLPSGPSRPCTRARARAALVPAAASLPQKPSWRPSSGRTSSGMRVNLMILPA